MRLALRGDTLVERLGLRLGLVPVPAAQVWGGMALAGVLIAATRVGLTARLAAGPASTVDLAGALGLDPTVTQLMLDCLRAAGHVRERRGRYRLSRASRRWLDPASRLSVAAFVAANADYWSWWSTLDEVARTGQPEGHHDAEPDDPYWRAYVLGQDDLARLTAATVAKRIPVPGGRRSVLDIGGGHGRYTAELCRRHPGLSATVLDLPGSARVGRELIEAAGLGGRVRHVDGDARTAALGGPYDVVLCFNVVHHFDEQEIIDLLRRAHDAVVPGGTLAVLDAFATPAQRGQGAAAVLNLFTFLSSGVSGYTPDQLAGWLRAAGFEPPRRVALHRIPGLTLHLATRPRG